MARVRVLARAAACAAALAGGAAQAQSVATEVHRLGGSEIVVHLHGFLSAEERQFLQLLATLPEALELMLGGPGGGGHAAMAVAPGEGLLRDAMPAPSAHAVAQLPDAAAARAAARAGCDAARAGGAACVVVLEIAPAR